MTTQTHANNATGFPTVLAAAGRSPEIPQSADVYGWLIGSWDLDVRHYFVNVADRGLRGEAHFAWVLEGRAVQDVWLMPQPSDRQAGGIDPKRNMYGTTLRVWDPSVQAWRVTWVDPTKNMRCELVGRMHGHDIVQIGRHADGTPIRWIFSDITADSFRWTGEALNSDGKSWQLQGEFLGRRRR